MKDFPYGLSQAIVEELSDYKFEPIGGGPLPSGETHIRLSDPASVIIQVKVKVSSGGSFLVDCIIFNSNLKNSVLEFDELYSESDFSWYVKKIRQLLEGEGIES